MARNLHSLIRDLQRRKARERRGMVVVEGRRLVEDALEAGAAVVGLVAAADVAAAAEPVIARALARGVPVETVTQQEFDALADTETPSGLMAVVEWEPLALGRLGPPPGTSSLALVLDAVQDPGNVGTMIRTAHALGAWATIALDGTADVRGPKALRGSMGSVFRHRVAEAAWSEFVEFAGHHRIAFLLAAQDGAPADRREPRSPHCALVVGSEGHGVRAEWSGQAHRRVGVPMRPGAESLNAAMAAGILLYELTRDPR
jgi:TrmH family RNA methyltransferase